MTEPSPTGGEPERVPEDADLPLLPLDLPSARGAITRVPLNLSVSVGGGPVAEHRRRLGEWLGAPVCFARQVHGAQVHRCTRADLGGQPAADAVISTDPQLAVGVLVADCVPLLLSADGVVAAVHAGRRGVVAGVVPAAIAALTRLGVAPAALTAVIGPAICGACYELPESVQQEVTRVVPAAASRTSWGTPAVDLPGAVAAQLAGAGVTARRVGGCTLEDEQWYSHRGSQRDGARPIGRFAAVVVPLG